MKGLARSRAPWVRKFGNLCIREILVVTWPYVRPTTCPSAPEAYQYKQVWKEIAWPPGNLEREEKIQSRVFFDVIFDVYTYVDNSERARASDSKQRRRISMEEKHENFIAAVRKWEMLAAGKVKLSGSEKNNNMTTKSLVSTYDNSTIKTRGTFRQVPRRRIRLSFVECAYPDLRDLLHNFRGLQWIPP